MSTNRSGEPSKEVVLSNKMEGKRDLASTKEAQGDDAPVSMSFIRRIIDSSEEALSRGTSVPAIDTSDVELDKGRGVSFSGVSSTGSVASSTGDEDKDREELIMKVQTLKLDLKQAKLDKSAEKAMNRKKDRNLVKLAKELNRRGEEIKEKTKEISELTNTVATLEAKLAANKKELDERVATNEKQTREHNLKVAELTDEQRKAWKQHQAKLAEVQEKHIKASEEHVDHTDRMRKEILASNRTIETLRAEVARLGTQEEADKMVRRSMTAPLTKADIPVKKLKITKEMCAVLVLIIALVVGSTLDLLSMNAVCAPVKPGTELVDNLESEAPWWAPSSMKSGCFAPCGKRPRTRVSWTVGKPGNNLLSVVDVDSEAQENLLQKKVASAIIQSGSISTTDKKGASTEVKAPWAS